MKGNRRGGALLGAIIVLGGCQAVEPRVHQMYVEGVAKNDAMFEREGVRRVLPASFSDINEAIDRTLAEQGVFADGATLDFAGQPPGAPGGTSPAPTNPHVKSCRTYGTVPSGHSVSTNVVSNWYRLVAVRVEEKNDGCEVTAFVLVEKKGDLGRSVALLDRIGEALGKSAPPGAASNLEGVGARD